MRSVRTGVKRIVAASLVAAGCWSLGAAAQVAPAGQPPTAEGGQGGLIDPAATALLKRMSDYMGKLKAYSVHARNTNEVLLTNGQKLEFEATSDVIVERPNHLRSNRVGDVTEVEFYYDGSTVTLYGRKHQYYATAPAPASMDQMLDHIRQRLSMEPPGADLLYSNIYDGLIDGVSEARVIGPAVIGGAKTTHLAFRASDVDWQIWIEDGDRPLPRKYVITTKWTTGSPDFGVEFSDWNLSPKIDKSTFVFTPPKGAQKIDFLPAPAAQ